MGGAFFVAHDFVCVHIFGRVGFMPTLFHVAPHSVRESIEQHGLDSSKAPYDRSTFETGFYAFGDLIEAVWYAKFMSRYDPSEPVDPMDVWEFESDAVTEHDGGLTNVADEETSAVYHPRTVREVRLVRTVR